jgi:hypothetical protein
VALRPKVSGLKSDYVRFTILESRLNTLKDQSSG